MKGTTNIDSTRGGQIIYDNTSSGLSATNVQEAIDEVYEEVTKSVNLSDAVSITETAYTTQSDGYLYLYNTTATISRVRLSDPLDSTFYVDISSVNGQFTSIYVRKGLLLRVVAGTPTNCYFRPVV